MPKLLEFDVMFSAGIRRFGFKSNITVIIPNAIPDAPISIPWASRMGPGIKRVDRPSTGPSRHLTRAGPDALPIFDATESLACVKPTCLPRLTRWSSCKARTRRPKPNPLRLGYHCGDGLLSTAIAFCRVVWSRWAYRADIEMVLCRLPLESLSNLHRFVRVESKRCVAGHATGSP
jgi:hypothetical protein